MTSLPDIDRTISPALTVNELLARYPLSGSVLNAFGLDTCCGGLLSIRDAAIEAGAAPEQVLSALETHLFAPLSTGTIR